MGEQSLVSRRNVLRAAAVGATGVAITSGFPSSAAKVGAAQASGSLTLRWGVIGTGTRGAFTHIPVLKEAPESQIVALCDIAETRLQSAAAKVDKPVATFSNYQKLLADPDINAVVIAVPNLLHHEILLAALQAGKHVLCEKPAGATPADATAMKQAVDSAKTVVMFGMQYRNTAKNRKIGELVASGRIGKPRYLVQNCSRGDWNLSPNVWQYADPKLGGRPMNWRFSHAATGGTLNEFDCHYFDLLHWFVGALPQRIACDGGISVYKDGRDTWDHASVTLTYPDGVIAVHTLCLFGPSRADLQIMGDEGAIETVGDIFRVVNYTKRGKTGPKSQAIQAEEPHFHSADHATLGLYQDFVECVRTGKKPDANVDRAVAASRTCWLAEMAAQRKAEVQWDELTVAGA